MICTEERQSVFWGVDNFLRVLSDFCCSKLQGLG